MDIKKLRAGAQRPERRFYDALSSDNSGGIGGRIPAGPPEQQFARPDHRSLLNAVRSRPGAGVREWVGSQPRRLHPRL